MDRIRAAGYTAKTDHLRRMVDYSRQVRLTRATPLDAANWFGRKLWWAGLFLQILWQVSIVGAYLLPSTIPNGDNTGDLGFDSDAIIDDSTTGALSGSQAQQTATALVLLQPLLRFLVYRTEFLRSACIAATLASFWWNPFFVQTVRGFTKHLLGIPTWYGYQVTIFAVRLILAKVVDYQAAASGTGTKTDSGSPTLPPTVAGVHAVTAFFIFYLYTVAPGAIRKDVRPLFAKLPETPLTPQRANTNQIAEQRQHELQQSENRRRGLETLSDVLDEISATPQRRTPGSMMQSSPLARRDSDTDGWDGWQPSQAKSQNGFGSQQSTGNIGWQTGAGGRDTSFSSLSLNGGAYGSTMPASQPPLSWSQEQQQYGQVADADEMDWTPTQPTQSSHLPAQSPHRAFNTYEPGQSQNQFGRPHSSGAFSQTPVEADRGPFWYKVPPAPTSIAQRIFNRPNAPRLVNMEAGEDDVDTKKNAFFQNGSPGRQSRQLNLGLRDSLAGASSSVEFAQPSFFAEDFQRKSKAAVNGAKGANGMNGRGRPADNDDPDNVLSDLFSQTFSLAGEKEDAPSTKVNGLSQRASRLRASSSVRTSGSSSSSSSSFFGRAASLMTTVASLAAVYCLQDITSSSSSMGGGADALVAQFVQPYARLIEAATVVYCAALALSLTLGSAKRRGLCSVVGLLLGLASLALAGWMVTQMWAMLQQTLNEEQAQQRPPWPDTDADVRAQDNGETYGWLDNSIEQQESPLNESTLPWQWWQLASLHGTVLAHQAWSMLVQ